MAISDLDIALTTIFGFLTIILAGVIILTYMSSKELRQHPSGLIAVLSVFEISMAYHNIIYAHGTERISNQLYIPQILSAMSGYTIKEVWINKLICAANQLVLSASVVGVITTNIEICLDLIITLWNPFLSGFKRRKYYNVIQVIVISYFTLFICFQNDFIYTCSNDKFQLEVSNLGSIIMLLFVYLILAIFSCIYAAIAFYRGLSLNTEQTRLYLRRHILYVVTFVTLWFFPALSYFLIRYGDVDYTTVNTIAIATIASSGLLLGLLRISEPMVWQIVKSFSFFEMSRNSSSVEDAWNKPLSSLVYSEINSEVTKWVFMGLHTAYRAFVPDSVYEERTKGWHKMAKTHHIQNYLSENKVLGLGDYVPDMKITEYSLGVFAELAGKAGFSLQSIAESLDPSANIQQSISDSDGKSGSFFLFTHDKKLVIKTIRAKEKSTMNKLVKDYHEHLLKTDHSCLCGIFGLFTIKVPGVAPMHLIIMENINYNLKPIQVFDIKGSLRGRTAFKSGEKVGPYKDLDFKRMEVAINVSNEVVETVLECLLRDIGLLKSHNLIDYSLLICISPNEGKINSKSYLSLCEDYIYTFVIIDYLTKYDYFKFLEEKFSRNDASVKKPREYANRFINYIFSIIFKHKRNFSSFVRSISCY